MITQTLKEQRRRLGITQGSLANKAGVSLPAVQLIESGRGNPSLDTLGRLCKVLGLELHVSRRSVDWDALSALGAPLVGAAERPVRRDASRLVEEIRLALLSDRNERQTEAVTALLAALQAHYPSLFSAYFAKSGEALKLLKTYRSHGRLIRLRRLALSRISTYL